jgi:Glu-tRNA(Gln) amidotransferase subunit E-like FAD-binding protein
MNNDYELAHNNIVKNLMYYPVGPSPLYLVHLPKTKCKIIKNNGYKIYCAKYPLIKGLFRKDVDETKKYGRLICDTVAAKFNNFGFFTSDERPEYGVSYGITKKEYDYIFEQVGAREEEHLVVMFAYDEKEALKSQDFFEKLIRKTYFTYTLDEKTLNMFFGDL